MSGVDVDAISSLNGVVVEQPSPLFDGIEILALSIEIVEQSDDGYFSLVKFLILKQVSEGIKREYLSHFIFSDLIPALSQVGHQVQIFHKVEPSRGVFTLSLTVELSEGHTNLTTFIKTSLDDDTSLFLTQAYFIYRPSSLYLFEEEIHN